MDLEGITCNPREAEAVMKAIIALPSDTISKKGMAFKASMSGEKIYLVPEESFEGVSIRVPEGSTNVAYCEYQLFFRYLDADYIFDVTFN